MIIKTRETKLRDITILELYGELTSEQADMLRVAFEDLLNTGNAKILIDLKGVPLLDSSGVGEICRCRSSAVKTGVRFGLFDPSKRFIDIFATAPPGYTEYFEDERSAIESFAKEE